MVTKIYPSIGIARVGESDNFYYGPESYRGLPLEPDDKPFTSFRDKGKLRKQAARFRIYQVNDLASDNLGSPVVPGQAGVSHIEWVVWLANKKAVWYEFQQLDGENGYGPGHPRRNAKLPKAQIIIDAGPQMVSSAGPQTAQFAKGKGREGYAQSFPPANITPASIDTLGEIRTDKDGILTVLGGYGHSGSMVKPARIGNYANNPGWFDDVSDGPVSAVIVMDNGHRIPVDVPAWVVVAPPAYAPQIPNMVTLYDTMYDLFVRKFDYVTNMCSGGKFKEDYKPDYHRDIEPLLRRPELNNWVIGMSGIHSFDWDDLANPDPSKNAVRAQLLGMIRQVPDDASRRMPLLAGDNPLSSTDPSPLLILSETSNFLLSQWAQGKFTTEVSREGGGGNDMDRGILSNCVGGAFCPGIEVTWICRNEKIYASPFRIHHKWTADEMLKGEVRPGPEDEDLSKGLEPGDLCKYMAQPWQADFNECSIQPIKGLDAYWWPAQRPMKVQTAHGDIQDWSRKISSDMDMVENWSQLGFVRQQPDGSYAEVEREETVAEPALV